MLKCLVNTMKLYHCYAFSFPEHDRDKISRRRLACATQFEAVPMLRKPESSGDAPALAAFCRCAASLIDQVE